MAVSVPSFPLEPSFSRFSSRWGFFASFVKIASPMPRLSNGSTSATSGWNSVCDLIRLAGSCCWSYRRRRSHPYLFLRLHEGGSWNGTLLRVSQFFHVRDARDCGRYQLRSDVHLLGIG